MSDLLRQLQSTAASASDEIAQLWLALWAHPHGLAVDRILQNLQLAISEHFNVIKAAGQPEDAQLLSWLRAIKAIQPVLREFEGDAMNGITRKARTPKSHPLARHGLIAHGIYAGCWNQHEGLLQTGNKASVANMDASAALRRLQLHCVRAQAALASRLNLTLSDYLLHFSVPQEVEKEPSELTDTSESSDDKSSGSVMQDYFEKRHHVSLHTIGWALRELSWLRHAPMLACINELLQADVAASIAALGKLDRSLAQWQSDDSATQHERLKIATIFRAFADKFAGYEVENKTHRRRQGRTRRTGSGQIASGFLGSGTPGTLIRHDQPPEDLPEFPEWIPSEELQIIDDDGQDDSEAPRRIGLHLIDPKDIAGSLARLKAQQHYLAMLRQGFTWDDANLSDAESQFLRVKLSAQLATPVEEFTSKSWWTRTLVLIAWLFGRPMAEVAGLRLRSGKEVSLGYNDLAVLDDGHTVRWRLPLRQPNVSAMQFDGRLARIDHILVDDLTGLGEAIAKRHRLKATRSELVFSSIRSPATRVEMARHWVAAWDRERGGLGRLIPARLERALRISLFYLCSDRTVGWMLAGTAQQAVEPRMFYAAHTPQELQHWLQRVQQQLLGSSPVDDGTKPVEEGANPAGQTLTGARGKSGVEHYAGCRVFVQWQPLRKVCASLAWNAQLIPPERYRSGSSRKAWPKTSDRPPGSWWDDQGRWQRWCNDVVLWAWLVQSLHTGMRAVQEPNGLYQQWLSDPQRPWLSLEDKVTRDHDESRLAWVSPLLRQAFVALTAAHQAYARRWAEPAGKRNHSGRPRRVSAAMTTPIPTGFMVFDEHEKIIPLRPKWVVQKLKSITHHDWPANFPRALLRRALSERGLTGDQLDAFMGHGALADRVHDRHSLFDPQSYAQALSQALQAFSEDLGLRPLAHGLTPRLKDPGLRKFMRAASGRLRDKEKQNAAKSGAANAAQADDAWSTWLNSVQALTGDSVSSLKALRPWHVFLRDHQHHPLLKLLLLEQKAADNDSSQSGDPVDHSEIKIAPCRVNVITPEDAQAAEKLLLQAVLDDRFKRSVAAFGFNLAYRIGKALDPELPTMRLALTPAARVSAYTVQRISSAAKAQKALDGLRAALKQTEPQKQPSLANAATSAGLASFVGVAANTARWSAMTGAMSQTDGHLVKGDSPAYVSYNYALSTQSDRNRQCRGYLDPVMMSLRDGAALKISASKQDDYRDIRRNSQNKMLWPPSLSGWTESIRWWSHLHLPALVAEHAAGTLDDQCCAGPFGQLLTAQSTKPANRVVASRAAVYDEAQQSQAIWPPGVVPQGECQPLGWLNEFETDADSSTQWLRNFLLVRLASTDQKNQSELDQKLSIEQLQVLSETLDEAMVMVPSRFRRRCFTLVTRIRQFYRLPNDPETDTMQPGLDRQVVDGATYMNMLNELSHSCATHRHQHRHRRLRMLIVLAFRFGLRRDEILGLRRVDIDLQGSGRLYVRAYDGHPLKTSFSRRSLPITPLLGELERQWLKDLHDSVDATLSPLFPQHERDTLPRQAIQLLRKISCDESLKLHHLRHSFASLLTLKLVLARHPQWIAAFDLKTVEALALDSAPSLLGTLLKPDNASGDFIAIARLMGHSSYEVTLTNYAHTLDLVCALYQTHQLSSVVLPDRELGMATGQRFDTARKLRRETVRFGVEAAKDGGGELSSEMSSATRRSQALTALLAAWFQALRDSHTRITPTLPLTVQQLTNWFTPRQAVGLKQRLLDATDLLTDADLQILKRLGGAYWQSNPPMFWFNATGVKLKPSSGAEDQPPGTSTAELVMRDLERLFGLLKKTGFDAKDLVFWRYANADESLHRQFWRSFLLSQGYKYRVEGRSGRATTVGCLGVSLHVNHVKRSELVSVWLVALAAMAPGAA